MFEWKALYAQTELLSESDVAEIEYEKTYFSMYALACTIIFTIVVYAFEFMLDKRQEKAYKGTQFPSELETTVSKIDAEKKAVKEKDAKEEEDKKEEDDEKKNEKKEEEKDEKKNKVDRNKPLLPQLKEKFEKSQLYGTDKIKFSMFSSTYGTLIAIVCLFGGSLPKYWDLCVSWGTDYFGWTESENEIKISLLFFVLSTILDLVIGLPLTWYSTFHIEKKHGFNKQTPGLFWSDQAKSLALTFVIGCPVVALVLKIIKWGGDYFYIYVWAFMCVFSVFMMTIVPVFIMPLFNKYEPLEDGELKKRIYALADKLNYPLTKLFVMDGSKRSSHSNAFMFGFGNNKRIVLFDTLMEQVEDDEILAILGHELGHWKLGHTLTNFFISQIYTGVAFYCFSLCYNSEDLYYSFGFDDPNRPIATIIALMVFFQTIWAPIDKAISFVMTMYSRQCEFDADRFSVDLGMSRKLQTGLCKISLENLGAMCPDPWYATYHYSHPPLVQRLSAMMALEKKTK